jgi:DNA-directed RNA polymerase subunit H (RpoH/RPB5)
MEKSATLIKRSAINTNFLDNIKVGDLLSDEYGKSGKVCEIEKISRHGEFHYYFKLLKSGTILIIL